MKRVQLANLVGPPLAILLLLLPCVTLCGAPKGKERPLVGINYFAGWWEASPNKWQWPPGDDWRPRYPDRIPLLGEYNSQTTMDREIREASRYGADFFNILWYYPPPGIPSEPHAPKLNLGLKHFIASKNARRMKFMIEFCNHPPFLVKTEKEWAECIDAWRPAFRHPSYLRVGGKLLFKIHSGHHFFVEENNGDIAGCRRRIEQLRAEVRKESGCDMLIGFGGSIHDCIQASHPLAGLCDFSNTYMDVPPVAPAKQDYPYADLSAFIRDNRLRHTNDALPYVPFVAAGWNPRPWGAYNNTRPSFAPPSKQEWTAELRNVAADLDRHPNFGARSGERRFMIFTIYAWNEYGEGGYVAPTRGEKRMKLEAIREVFGKQVR